MTDAAGRAGVNVAMAVRYLPLDLKHAATPKIEHLATLAGLEAAVREQPDQYLWIHRRFKTRPPGEADVYR